MKAACWMGKHDVRVEDVPDPQILNRRDAIVKVSSTAICGSDLHLYNGYVPTMKEYDIMGHEFMGEVVEVGPDVHNLSVGDRVLVPFQISCGGCYFCKSEQWSNCDNSNPNAGHQENVMGHPAAGMFGYSHMFGGYDGGQAEYVRVPFADVGPVKIENDLPDEKLLFLTDILPTGYQAAKQAGISPGDVVAVWGCGPVGQFAIASALILGAERVIAIDREPVRLGLAEKGLGADTINFETPDLNVVEELSMRTGGRGPDVCIDAVGLEAFGHGAGAVFDWAKQMMRMESDRPNVLRQCIEACRKGGTISIPGVYGGLLDGIPFGSAFGKGLTFKMGQTHVKQHVSALLDLIERGSFDPSFIVTHEMPLAEAPTMYKTFKDKADDCIKVVLKPFAA
jgi:threonine dehydrogenase-like Zn-dependent dehydrogenase